MLFQEFTLPQADTLNAALYERFMQLRGTERVRETHHFGGRFENIYVDRADIPEIDELLEVLRQQAAKLLAVPKEKLKAGFWFNAMEPGHRTSMHHHDENDELLSAAYYICVPENSGDLVLHDDDKQLRVHPREGKLVMFAPSMMHEVTVHEGAGLRLSVGMNVGPADD